MGGIFIPLGSDSGIKRLNSKQLSFFIIWGLVLLTFIFPVKLNFPSYLHLRAGGETKVEEIQPFTLWGFPSWFRRTKVVVENKELILVTKEGEKIAFQPRRREGKTSILVGVFPVWQEVEVEVFPNEEDRDKDGFPDMVELNTESERDAFREFFVQVARLQIDSPHPQFKERDCGGLVRFAYRESLKRGDILPYAYPQVPLLGVNIFRVKPGGFNLEKISEDFSVFASSFYLLAYNVISLGKEEGKAKTGDLLFFFQPTSFSYPYHVMIYEGEGRVIYHTGPIGEGEEVRETTLASLRKHPDKNWHPTRDNPNFLGFFRWKILD